MFDACAPPHVYLLRVNVGPKRPDSLDAQLLPSVVLAVAPAGPWTRLHLC